MKRTRLQKLHQQVRKAQMEIEAIQNSVVALFLDNLTLPEIARMNGSHLDEVIDILCHAHHENKVDLIPWIEKNINAKPLFKGIEYFTRNPEFTFESARETLGLDINTLKFSKLYAMDTQARKEGMRR